MKGILYIVSTPIGNLEDITLRALRILKEVDIILCEDTRYTSRLLNHYEIKKSLRSHHAFNEHKEIEAVLKELNNGRNIALVCDKGTPGISDPGYLLTHNALKEGITLVPIPGPSAFLTLLSVSGFPIIPFQFIGFLDKRKGKRLTQLSKLSRYLGLIILYESPYRIKKLLEDLLDVFGNCNIFIGRELTKRFEEYYRGTLKEVLNNEEKIKVKGEYSIILNTRIIV